MANVAGASGGVAEGEPDINVLPIARFELPAEWDRLDRIQLDASDSFDPDSSLGQGIVRYEWDVTPKSRFAHYFFPNSPLIDFQFQDWGPLVVTLRVYDALGAVGTLEQTIEVHQPSLPPQAVISDRTEVGVFRVAPFFSYSFDPDDEGRLGNHIAQEQWTVTRLDVPSDPYVFSDSSTFEFIEPGRYLVSLEVVDDEGDTASNSQEMLVRADFVNVAIHGWMPLPIDVLGAETEFANLATKWSELSTIEEVPAGSREWNFSHHWNAHDGFTAALIARTAYEATRLRIAVESTVNPLRPDDADRDLLKNLKDLFHLAHYVSQGRAELAARDLANSIADSDFYHPEEDLSVTPVVNLVGYSRGGYVAARASEILEMDHFLTVRNVSVLDGFDRSWPGIAGIVGDGFINDTFYSDESRNYRVQESLLPDLIDTFVRLLDSTPLSSELTAALSEPELIQAIQATLTWFTPDLDWRAPTHSAFRENILINGADDGPLSNHRNVHTMYFGELASARMTPVWMVDSPMFDLQWGTGETPADAEPDDLQFVDVSRFSNSLGTAAIAEMIALRHTLAGLVNYFDGPEVWLNGLLASYASPGVLEQLVFGNAQATLVESPVAGVSFPANEPLTVTLRDSGPRDYRMDLIADLSVAGAVLSITVDGEPIMGLPTLTAGENQLHFSLPSSLSDIRIVDISWQGGNGGAVVLAGITPELGSNNVLFELSASVIVDDVDELRLTAATTVPPGLVLEAYLDANGIDGLQLGGQGDLPIPLTRASLTDTWTFEAALVPEGTYQLLVIQNRGGVDAVMQEFSLERGTSTIPFTNRGNIHDVNRDLVVTPLDAVLVVNHLNSRDLSNPSTNSFSGLTIRTLLDVNADALVSPIDALLVINRLNERPAAAEAESTLAESTSAERFAAWLAAQETSHLSDWLTDDTTTTRRNRRR